MKLSTGLLHVFDLVVASGQLTSLAIVRHAIPLGVSLRAIDRTVQRCLGPRSEWLTRTRVRVSVVTRKPRIL
ncbi:hypothetical protein LZ32DRAFT_607553 [Colletotrichum eremochloae]|nr:hypothetical protein LZ32DRAFT_607553 [Colletotrichum eremochloae]